MHPGHHKIRQTPSWRTSSSKRTRLTDLNIAKLDRDRRCSGFTQCGTDFMSSARLEAFGDGKEGIFTITTAHYINLGATVPTARSSEPFDSRDVPERRCSRSRRCRRSGEHVAVDVFRERGKFYLVPIYQSDRVTGRPLPTVPRRQTRRVDQWRFDRRFVSVPHEFVSNDLVHPRNRRWTSLAAPLDWMWRPPQSAFLRTTGPQRLGGMVICAA